MNTPSLQSSRCIGSTPNLPPLPHTSRIDKGRSCFRPFWSVVAGLALFTVAPSVVLAQDAPLAAPEDPVSVPIPAESAAGDEATAPAKPKPGAVLSPEDRALFLKLLEDLGNQRQQMRSDTFQGAVRQLRALVDSPTDSIKFYEQSVRELRFTGQDDNLNSPYRNWIDQNRELHRDGNFRTALQVHLKYLMLTLQYLGTPDEDKGQVVQPLVDYVKSYTQLPAEVRSGPGAREFLNMPLERSVFVQKLQLQDELQQLEEWELQPGNLAGIEEVAILPLLRKTAPDKVVDFWEFKIGRESAEANDARLMVTAANFQNLRLPSLHWQRAQDMVVYGNTREALLEMSRIVKTHPNHPNFPSWVDQIRGYLE